jgi:hypothetical protein
MRTLTTSSRYFGTRLFVITPSDIVPSLKMPDTYGHLSLLKYLYLDHNQLTGTIPGSLGALTDLNKLYLQSNQLNGTVPDTFSHLKHLTELKLQDNGITGDVPPTVCHLVDQSNTLVLLSADCKTQVNCTCCHECY